MPPQCHVEHGMSPPLKKVAGVQEKKSSTCCTCHCCTEVEGILPKHDDWEHVHQHANSHWPTIPNNTAGIPDACSSVAGHEKGAAAQYGSCNAGLIRKQRKKYQVASDILHGVVHLSEAVVNLVSKEAIPGASHVVGH